jgi:hypothetical protein
MTADECLALLETVYSIYRAAQTERVVRVRRAT